MTTNPRPDVKEALTIFSITIGVCTALYWLRPLSAVVASNIHVLFAALFLLVPTHRITRRGQEMSDFDMRVGDLRASARLSLMASALVFPAFAVAFKIYYGLVCDPSGVLSLRRAAGYCRRFLSGWHFLRWPRPPRALQEGQGWWAWIVRRFPAAYYFETVLAQVVVVALPEEMFFRGYMQSLLRGPAQAKLPLKAIFWASVLFAIGHVAVDFNPMRLAVFFPSLLFGWLKERTGGLAAPVYFHAACNVLSDLLHRTYFPPLSRSR